MRHPSHVSQVGEHQLHPQNKPLLSQGHCKKKRKETEVIFIPTNLCWSCSHSPTDLGLRQHLPNSVWQWFGICMDLP